ncbi:MAG: hypothetical protein JNN30_01980 [Rhodanobacteraceae bacterium]|nr:hypothetical protein [Rhodanobacteraceae bacterium]
MVQNSWLFNPSPDLQCGREAMRLVAGCFLALFCSGVLAQNLRPGRLLIFYAWPSTINGANANVAVAAGHFGQYSHVVLGNGLQDAAHPDHQRTRSIMAHAGTAQTLFFGYIPLGARPGDFNLSLGAIAQRVQQWAAMGVDGILLDEYGYDYGVTRERQNAAVSAVRAQSLAVIANSWRPEDAFGSQVSGANASGAATLLDSRDYYLSESHQLRNGVLVDPAAWLAKEQSVSQFRAQIGFKVLSVTTSDLSGTFNAQWWNYAWYSAALFDHAAVGWGELYYSAGNALAPFRARPAPDTQPFLTNLVITGTRFSRRTCIQELWIDTANASSGHSDTASCDLLFRDGFGA